MTDPDSRGANVGLRRAARWLTHADAAGPASSVTESPHARQLERGFPALRFEAPLEEEFRRHHRAEMLPQIRRSLWLALVFVVGFSALTHLVLEAPVNRLLDVIRVATFGPLLLGALVLVHTPLYARWYARLCLIGAPLFGIGVVVLAVIAQTHGVSLIASVVLVSIYIYVMLGMGFRAALGAALAVFAAYFVVATALAVPGAIQVVDGGVLAFTNVVGAIVSYTLERARRTRYLEERLLIEAANRDGLTGIYNRRLLDEHLAACWSQALEDRAPLALLLVDIDHFKPYNDHYGHQAGDECLRRVAACLAECVRSPLEIAARYGGEEFAIVLCAARRERVEEVVFSIEAAIAALDIPHGASRAAAGRLTVSIGAACVEPSPDRRASGLIQLADEALYAAKARGRDRVVILDREYAKLHTGVFRKRA